MADTIKVSIELADAAAQKSLSDFITKSGKVDEGFHKIHESGEGAFHEITVGIGKSIGAYEIFEGNIAANVAIEAFNLLKEAATELFHIMVTESVHASAEAEVAFHALNVALGQNGIYSKEASERFREFSGSLQDSSTFSHKVIEQNAAIIESMAHLDEDGLKRATTAAVNLSAAFGKDLDATSRALAKAAEGNTTAIKKLGVQFEESGTTAGTFNNILKAVEDQLGGSAEGKIHTFAGAIQQTKNQFEDLQENLGDLITKNPAIIAAIGAVGDILKELTHSVEGGKDSFTILVAEGFVAFINGTTYVVKALDVMVSSFRIAYNTILQDNIVLVGGVNAALALLNGNLKGAFDKTIETFKGAGQAIEDVKANGSLGEISRDLTKIGDAAQEGLKKLKSGAEGATEAIHNNTKGLKKHNDALSEGQKEIDAYVKQLAKQNDAVKDNYTARLEIITAYFDKQAATNTKEDDKNYGLALERENLFYENKRKLLEDNLEFARSKIAQSTVSPETKRKAELELDKKFYADSEKLAADHDKKDKQLRDASDKQLLDDRKATLTTIATLSSSNNKTLADIGKAAAIAQIAIDTPQAISKALASAPPPFNFALATLVGVAEAEQAAKIAGLNFATGGIVPGTSFSGDNVQANVNSGEMILNSQQQAELFKVANGKSAAAGAGISRQDVFDIIEAVAKRPIQTSVQIDGREIFNALRDQVNSGRAY